jgi:hypothetical protein
MLILYSPNKPDMNETAASVVEKTLQENRGLCLAIKE